MKTETDTVVYVGCTTTGTGTGTSASLAVRGDESSGNPTVITITIEYEIRLVPSTVTIENSGVSFGQNLQFTLNNDQISEVRHDAYVSFGNAKTDKIELGVEVNTGTITIPVDWAKSIPNVMSGTASLAVETYNGDSFLGATFSSFSVSVPSYKPTISRITVRDKSDVVPKEWKEENIFVQSLSEVEIEVEASTSHGAKIVKYSLSGVANLIQASKVFKVGTVSASGEIPYMITVEDSRGQVVSLEKPEHLSVSPYKVPRIIEASAVRCLTDGTEYEEGTFIKAFVEYEISSCEGKNQATVGAAYRSVDDDRWNMDKSINPSEEFILGGSGDGETGNISLDSTYQVKFSVKDSLGTTTERTIDVGTYMYTIHYKSGGKGVAFGKASEQDYKVELEGKWDILREGVNVFAKLKELDDAIAEIRTILA